ncbi:MAG TPA: lysylphosphatidylglycerol synthase transmembrane domain-containing protein [Solirubrobacterales bacterium]|nr:lysylphosphatidylglycerol synthase transmembrane domain-containing protein [Solirubrobacterales bacterium]
MCPEGQESPGAAPEGPTEEATAEKGVELPLFSTRRMVQTGVLVLVLLVAIYFLFPKLVGLENALGRLDQADPVWIAVAIGFMLLSFAAYIALFKSVVGGSALRLTWSETYEINMAGLAATRIFSAGGAGGIALTYWGLRKAGMVRRDVARRMVAFLTLQYVFYPVALIIFGVLLRTGVMNGADDVELTIVPAGVSGLLLLLGVLVALIPSDIEPRLAPHFSGERSRALLEKIAKATEAVGEGFRFALGLLTHPSRGGLAVLGAIGYWATSIGVLWASFHAMGVQVPLAVVVQGFFLGMVANLFPLAPAGVGAVDAGMIGAFVLFGIPEHAVFPAILIFRLVAFWMPIPPGVIAFFQLRKTVHRWEDERLPSERGGDPEPLLAGAAGPGGQRATK